MLFKNKILEQIYSGEVTKAFRRWKRPSVKKGSLIHTKIGLIKINEVSKTTIKEITERDALSAGHKDLKSLIKDLKSRAEGSFYRIDLVYFGKDPRIKLRQRIKISKDEKEDLLKRIKSLEARSGKWVKAYLEYLHKNPGVRAKELSEVFDIEVLKFKANVRKLKILGFTISLSTGYKLSPRGEKVMKWL